MIAGNPGSRSCYLTAMTSRALPWALLVIAGCGGGGGGGSGTNPETVWLVNDGVETEVKLIDHEPPPF